MRADARVIAPLRASTNIVSVIEQLKKLPPLPSVAQEVLTRLNDEFVDGNEVADVVGRDPGITARLIGIANSAYFGLSRPVGNMREVVNRVLGVDTVRSLALALAARQAFDSSLCPAFNTRHFWVHSLLTSESCKKVAYRDEQATAEEREMAYSAGLCHNLGLMVLACIEPDRTHMLLQTHLAGGATETLRAASAREFGTDHREVTRMVAEIWKLPELLVESFRERCSAGSKNRLSNLIDASAESAGGIAQQQPAEPNLAPMASRLGMPVEVLKAAAPNDRQRSRAEAIVQGI